MLGAGDGGMSSVVGSSIVCVCMQIGDGSRVTRWL